MRITAREADDAAVDATLDAEEVVLRRILGDLVFGIDDETMESAVLTDLAARGLTLAVAETVIVRAPGDRLRIRGYATISLLDLVRKRLGQRPIG